MSGWGDLDALSSGEHRRGGRHGLVVVIGNPTLDTLVLLPGEEPDLAADGHFTHNVDTVGGSSGYCARGADALGHQVRLLGCLGADPAGRAVREVLVGEGIDCTAVFPDPSGTARSVNLVTRSGRRIFFYDGASHMTVQVPPELVTSTLDGADLVLCSLANWSREVLPAVRAAGIPLAVDLQDVRDPSDSYRADFIAAADYLFASAAHLSDPLGAARTWLDHGPARLVVLGMGPRGALLVPRRGAQLWAPPPHSDLPIVDTTGSGDGLAVGFLDGLVFAHLDPEAALERGQRWARLTASAVGGDHLRAAASTLA
jgi:sugar/nucleoside kinase (ribokinase family)